MEMHADFVSDNMDLNENNPSELKGEARRGIRTEVSGITLSKAKPRMVKIDGDLAQVVESDGRGYIPGTASPVHVEECGGCGVIVGGGCDTQFLPTLREEEEEDDEIYSSENSDSWSVVSSSYDSLNSSTECLLLNVAHPGLLSGLTDIDSGVADFLGSMMEEKTSRLGKISMRCGNCLEKFHWEAKELEACLFKHLAKCWERKKGVADLSPENDVDTDLESFEKEVVRSEFSNVKSLVSAMLANEWDFKPTRCAPECNRDHCREVRNDDTIDSEDLNDSDIWDDDICGKEALIDEAMKIETVDKNDTIETEDATELDASVVAEQRMLVFLVSSRGSIWQDKMAVALGLPTHATLDDMDSALRRLWVDCCGHASSLTIGQGGETFTFPDLEEGMDKLSITDKCKQVEGENRTLLETAFGKIGSTALYIYDPNRPTTLNISFMGAMDLAFTEEAEFPSHADFCLRGADMLRTSNRSPMPVTVLLRNTRPEVVCAECHESYVLLLDSNVDLQPSISTSPHGALFQPTGFCSMDCVVAFNEEMSLVPEHNDSIRVDRSQLVYMTNSPRAGMCHYASLDLDSSVNSRSTEGTPYSAFTGDTSYSCADCTSNCSINCSMSDYTDTDHSYSKSEGSPMVATSLIRNGKTGGTPVLTGYNIRSTSVDTPPTRRLACLDIKATRE